MATGPVVDQIAQEFASQPVVLLEYDVDAPLGNRLGRWWAAWSGSTPYLPLDQVDSGHQITSGFDSLSQFYSATVAMINTALPRAPQAVVKAYWQRTDTRARIWVSVTNLSPTSLSFDGNAAEVHAIVWEDVKVGVTSRWVRAAVSQRVTSAIETGATASFTLDTWALAGVDWSKLHCLALIDYRPGGSTGAFDMLQAGMASAPELVVTPDHLEQSVPADDDGVWSVSVSLTGPGTLQWTAESDAPWLSVSPTGGPVTTPIAVQVDPRGLASGLYKGSLTFTATGAGDQALTAILPVMLARGTSPVASFAGVASTPGQNNTSWRSEVMLHNPTLTATTIRAELVPRGQTAVAAATDLELASGATRLMADLYTELGAPQGAGTLRLQGQTNAWVRTFNRSAAGTFGQDAVNIAAESFAPGELVVFPVHAGADVEQEARSNLLLTNLEAAPLDLTLRCNGVTKTTTVPAGTYLQLDNVGHVLGLAGGVAVVEVQGPGRWSGSVSTVDPDSGDPTTVRGLPLAAATSRAFPGVARVKGLNGTAWRSEVTLHNPAGEAVEVRLDLVPRGSGTVATTRTIALTAGEVRWIPDVYTELGAPDGAACLRVSGPVLAWVRTYNQSAGATYGQDVPGWGAAAVAAGATQRLPVRTPASLTTGFRSNLLLLNLESIPVEATVSSGTRSLTMSLPAGGYAQADNVGARLGLAPGEGVLLVSSPGRWAGYVSTVDPLTGDPTTARGQ